MASARRAPSYSISVSVPVLSPYQMHPSLIMATHANADPIGHVPSVSALDDTHWTSSRMLPVASAMLVSAAP